MPLQKTSMSKIFAVTFVVMTISVIGGLIGMIIVYNIQLSEMKPTPRPTLSTTTTSPPPVIRLPTYLVPDRYDVELWPQLYTKIVEEVNVTSPNQTALFTGNSTVYFHCRERTTSIFLHSRDLSISASLVMNVNGNKVISSSWTHRSDRSDFLEVQLGEALQAGGNYSLFLAFSGEISSGLEGLYMSTYDEGDADEERFLTATMMEPTNTRSLFPCFDEPEMKAVFRVTIVHRRGTTALGNSPLSASNIIDSDWKYTRFLPTPRMSTYLFAFTVSEFTATTSEYERVKIRTYARPEATTAGHAKYAANVTGHILQFYESFFGINYEQRELDQIALPDLAPLAMENWGLVTYQEGSLLYEDGVSSLLHKESIALLVAHELAHQWFGNLVTMKWWNEVWLNEGFATYMSNLAVDAVEPTFKIKDTFVMSDLHDAFEEDALASSHPLSVPAEEIQTTSDVYGMFDSISYAKGASVLRMLADVMGESVFNDGIKIYLRAFEKGNTDQKDLWDSLQKAVDANRGSNQIAKLMDRWTNQIGYPVITINTTNGEIYQKQFLFNDTAESSLWWHVPITFMSNKSDSALLWLDVRGPVKKEEFISKSGEWILANINCTGYYRVNYNPENWDRLLTQLQTNRHRIPVMNRGQLVDDAFNLARAKLVNVTLALNSTRFLSHEWAFLPWESAVRNLKYFVLMFDRSEVYGPMQAYLRQQVKGLYYFFKNDTDHSQVPKDHSLQHNQILAIQVACSNELPACVEMAEEKFAGWMNSNSTNTIPPNLRSVIYCQALAAGGQEEWDFAWEKYQSSSDTSEQEQLREALSCTKKIWLLNRYLKYTLDPEKIRLMDVASTISNIAKNAAGHALAWNFIRAHWNYVSRGEGSWLISEVSSRFSTQFELDELERFAVDYELRGAYRAVEQGIEQTKVNIKWVGENRDAILQWFERETAKP